VMESAAHTHERKPNRIPEKIMCRHATSCAKCEVGWSLSYLLDGQFSWRGMALLVGVRVAACQ
jgi:hypothetical protein